MLCLGAILSLSIIVGHFPEALAEDCHGMSGLLVSRIRNLEKRMDIDLKIMKSELKRELNGGKKRRTAEDSSLLYEIRTIQTSMQQLFGGLENLKTELPLRQENVTTALMGTVAALQGDVRVLTDKVDDVQIKLSSVDEAVANLTKSVEDIDIEITDGTELPVTTQTTPEYPYYINYTSPPFYNYTVPPTSVSATVRLVGNSGTANAGTVEVFVDGVWGSVCDDDWDRDDAEVVCRMLGYGSVVGIYGEARYGQSLTSAIHFDGIDCTGDETSILDCRHYGIGITDCSHSEDAGVECSDPFEQTTPSLDDIQYRLVGGPNSYSGRVEVRYEGEWGTVCDDGFDENEASVVCRSLGISERGEAKVEAYYGTGSGPILMDSLRCTGSESSLDECDFNGWRVNDCSHAEDASVVCDATGATTPLVYTTTIITTVPSGVQYRLTDGPGPYAGRVEVYYRGSWGTVCDDQFDSRDAIVLCSSLGLNPSTINPVVRPEAFYGSGTGLTTMDNLDCNGTESSLDQCPFPGWYVEDCSHGEDVGVDCFGGMSSPPPPTTPSTIPSEPVIVRLVDGPTDLLGRVEVSWDGIWGTVCDDDFDYKEAAVICRSLGLSGGVAYKEARFGRGTGPIWLDDLKCGGNEMSLGDCHSNGWNNSNCGHEEDASVECQPAPTTTASTTPSSAAMIRLAEGSGPWEGRVEVYHNEEWGTVCDDEFGNNEAKIVCSMLGFKGGKAFQGSEKFGPGNGTIWMDDLMCAGDESSLFDCQFNGWGESNCGHGEDAGVECIMPVTIDSVQLVDGESDNVGRVEITINGVNGTVCDDDFDYRAATVLCRMLGYMDGGESYIEARYGEGSGQVILDDVTCTGNESSLAECDHREPFTSNCEHDEDVSVRCFLSNTNTTAEPIGENFTTTEFSPSEDIVIANFTEYSNFTDYIPETVTTETKEIDELPDDLKSEPMGENFTTTEFSPFTGDILITPDYIPETVTTETKETDELPDDLKSAPGFPPRNLRAIPEGFYGVNVQWDEPGMSNQSILGYNIYYAISPWLPIVQWTKTSTTNIRLALTGLKPNTTYTITVSAFNGYGQGPLSEPVQVFTSQLAHNKVPVLAAIAQALSPNEIAVRISWDPLDRTFDAITNFHVEYNDTYGEAGTSILHRPQGLGVIDHILSDLSAGTIYTIQVTGKGDFSDVIAMSDIRQEKTLEFVPREPVNVQAEVINETSIRVSWQPSPEEEGDGTTRGYMVIYMEVDEKDNPMVFGSEKVQENYDVNDHDIIITGLNPGSRYGVTVAGYTRRGDGFRSRSIYVTIERRGVYISKPPKDAKVAEDLIVSFFCEAFGDPRPRFHWEKNGKPLGTKQSRRYQVFDMPNGSVLRIEPVRGKRDNRTFTCVTKNDDDETRASASLLVYSSNDIPWGYPRIQETPVLTATERDHPFILSCQAISEGMSDPPKIYWLKDHTPVYTDDPRVHISVESRGQSVTGNLTIERSQESDQGKYECVAENEVGVAYSYTANVYVRVRKVPPHFTILQEEVFVDQGGSVNITCAAVGSPMPHVIWRREGDDDLDPDKQDTPFGENVLVLNNVQENTNYTCIATSVFGKIEANVQVKRVET